MNRIGKTKIINACLLLSTCLASLLIAEGLARTVIPVPHSKTFKKDAFYQDEELTGWRFKSDSSSNMRNLDFDIDFHISKANTRVKDSKEASYVTPSHINQLKASGNQVLFTIGDSQTFGHGLEHHESWPAALNSLLGENSHYVANFGMPGTDTNQFINLTRRLAIQYPKITHYIYGISDNDLCHYPEEALNQLEDQTPISSTFSGPEIEINTGASRPSLREIANNFAIGKAMIQAYRRINGYFVSQTNENPESTELGQKIRQEANDCATYTLNWMEKVAKFSEKAGRQSYFILVPKGETIIANNINALTTNQAKILKSAEVIDKNATAKSINLVNSYPAITAEYAKKREINSIMLPTDGHSNYNANKIIAKQVYSKLLEAKPNN